MDRLGFLVYNTPQKGVVLMKKISPMESGVQLNIAITSDNHMDVNCNNLKQRIKIMHKVLLDAQESTEPFDAYVTVGDTVSRGLVENWETVQKCFDGKHPAKQILFAIGNHDSWSKDGYKGYADGVQNYLKYSKTICGNDIDKPYFSRNIKGYHLIFLGSDQVPENEDCAAFSEAQILWFQSEMEKAGQDGKPIFVFCHQSVNTHHGLPKTWSPKENPDDGPEIGGIGEASDAIKSILEAHKNVFYFSGHSHMGLNGEKSLQNRGYASFENHSGVHYINLPCLTRKNHHGGNEKTGQGLVLEVYESRVLIRPRNFAKRKMNKKILIKDGKPYYEADII